MASFVHKIKIHNQEKCFSVDPTWHGPVLLEHHPMKMFCSITPTNLIQLSKSGTVLESAHPEDSKTVPES